MSGVAVVAGTVFNDILLWHLEGERPSSTRTTAVAGEERVIVRLALSGHEVMDQSGTGLVSWVLSYYLAQSP